VVMLLATVLAAAGVGRARATPATG
jgi:hypothetical protein